MSVVPKYTHPKGPLGWSALFFFSRFTVLMLMIIRFYLGAVTVINSDPTVTANPTNEAVNLLAGLAHFILFFAWANTLEIDAVGRSYLQFSEFEIFLLGVLLFDVAWWAMSYGKGFQKLTLWMVVNLVTALLVFAIHVVLIRFGTNVKLVESIAFLPVLAASLIDITEILGQREIFRGWLRSL